MHRYLLASVVVLACVQPSATPTSTIALSPAALDSVVLERTRCFGPCPVYRLRIDGRGQVHFTSPDPRGVRTIATDQLEAWVADSLAAQAERIGLAELPDDISTSSELCRFKWTDHPGIRLAIYGASVKQVMYDTGCYVGPNANARVVAPELMALKQFAARIDSLARAERWVQPHMFR